MVAGALYHPKYWASNSDIEVKRKAPTATHYIQGVRTQSAISKSALREKIEVSFHFNLDLIIIYI